MKLNHENIESMKPVDLSSLEADCEHCYALCCIALPFSASADFAMDKAAGQPCPNLQADFRCSIHSNLRDKGFKGCTVFDCFGAGQKVSQVTFGGQAWQQDSKAAKQMQDVFLIMRHLHEMFWYLTEALTLKEARPIYSELSVALDETERHTYLDPESLMVLDVAAHRTKVNSLLLKTSELVRAEVSSTRKTSSTKQKTYGRGADLIGAKLSGADLRGENLRGAYLIAADLREADLSKADLIGADFRDTDIRGANLSESIFLTQAQINAAIGDTHTKLPPRITLPTYW